MNAIACMTLLYHMRIQNCTLHISNDEDQPVSIVWNQSTNSNCNIAEYNNEVDGDKWDLWDADIKNQMNIPIKEIVNDDNQLNYGYRQYNNLI